MKANDNDIVTELISLYGREIKNIMELPKAFCPGGESKVKAIYLGCDPSNKYSTTLPYAFAHESNLKVFNSFIKSHTEQLKSIGLCWKTVYTQNLCRNYFEKETSQNLLLWRKVANEYWIYKLREELSQFNEDIPVLLTAQPLLQVLGTDGYEKILAPCFYELDIPLPIPRDKNKLKRNLIPLYRGKSPRFKVSYQLTNDEWQNYKNSVIQYLKKINI